MSRTVVVALLAGLLGAVLAVGTILFLYGPPGNRFPPSAKSQPEPSDVDDVDLTPNADIEDAISAAAPPPPIVASQVGVEAVPPNAPQAMPSPVAPAAPPMSRISPADKPAHDAKPARPDAFSPPAAAAPETASSVPPTPVASPPTSNPDLGHSDSPDDPPDVTADAAEVEEPPMVWETNKESIHQALRSQMPKMKECYEAWAAMQPDLAGRLKIGFTIGRANPNDETAAVTQADVVDSQFDNEFFQGCILRTVEDLKFVPPDGSIRVNIPFVFRQED